MLKMKLLKFQLKKLKRNRNVYLKNKSQKKGQFVPFFVDGNVSILSFYATTPICTVLVFKPLFAGIPKVVINVSPFLSSPSLFNISVKF